MNTTLLTTIWGALAAAAGTAAQVLPEKYAPIASIVSAFCTGLLGYHAAGKPPKPKK